MLQHSWYNFLKGIFKIGLFFTLKKLVVKGKENIPKKGPVIFIANHQNAFIDAILIPTTNNRNTYFLTRSNPFKNKIIAKILYWSNMYPVYRIQDGVNTIKMNDQIFKNCHELLFSHQALQIFAEGLHHLDRKVYPLKKGFARIIHGTLKKYPDLDIQIVPVGINYDHHLNFPASASVIYDKPIRANDYIDLKNPDLRYQELTSTVRKALKKLTLHIEETENYEELIQHLESLGIDYLDPEKAYETYTNRANLKPAKQEIKPQWFFRVAITLWKINSLIPLFLWHKFSKKITERIFTSTFRFAFALVVFPLFYALQTALIGYTFSIEIALLYALLTITLSLIRVKKGVIQK